MNSCEGERHRNPAPVTVGVDGRALQQATKDKLQGESGCEKQDDGGYEGFLEIKGVDEPWWFGCAV